jgi:hypothetical protein
LALATLNLIDISPKIIERLIAASGIYVGAETSCRERKALDADLRFGLIHGCGLLRRFGAGNWSQWLNIAVPLLSFIMQSSEVSDCGAGLALRLEMPLFPVFVHRLVLLVRVDRNGGRLLAARTHRALNL